LGQYIPHWSFHKEVNDECPYETDKDIEDELEEHFVVSQV